MTGLPALGSVDLLQASGLLLLLLLVLLYEGYPSVCELNIDSLIFEVMPQDKYKVQSTKYKLGLRFALTVRAVIKF